MLENTTIRKLDLFPSTAEGKETPSLFGPLEKVNFNHWSISETLCFLVFRISDDRQSS
jgi:hypothetical protein